MEYKMRESRVLKKMREGKVANCVKLNLSDPRNVEIAAMCGFDCVWLDMEHVPNTLADIENGIRAAKNYDCDVLTRVARGPYSNLIRPFEADSTGIMVPHLMSLEDAKSIVYYTKFHPIGRRPLDGGNADGKYCLVDGEQYVREANEQRFVVTQIEDPEPLSELEEICALPGIDMIFFGPGDFSQGLGTPCAPNPKIEETRKLIAKTARAHGKFAGTVGSPDNWQQLAEEGYNFISVGADVIGLTGYYQELLKGIGGLPE